MADAYDEMERLMKKYEALAQSDLPAALEKMIDLYFDETYENTFNYDVYDGIELWLQENADGRLLASVRKIISQLMTGKSGNNGFGLPYIMAARGIVPIRIQLRSHIFPVPVAENKVITDVRIQVT